MSEKIAVIGGGSWATAIAGILLQNYRKIGWWVREPEIKRGLETSGRNPLYLQDVQFEPPRLELSHSLEEVIREAGFIVVVVPAVYLPSAFKNIKPQNLQGKKICSAVKGIIPSCGQVVCEYLRDKYSVPEQNMSVISGPSHAEEIARKRLTWLTAASCNEDLARETARAFSCGYVQTRTSRDIYGIEYAAVLKNIYALCVGMAKGAGYGDNFAAVLVSNALEEMRTFLQRFYPAERDLATSPYLGDLLVTSYSQFSRNRTFGNMIGQGYSVKSAELEMKMVAEGYYAAGAVMPAVEKQGVDMPVLRAVYDVLYEGAEPRKTFEKLETFFK